MRTIIWSILPGGKPPAVVVEVLTSPRPVVVRRAQQAWRDSTGRIEVWPSPMGSGERLLLIGSRGRMVGPWAPPSQRMLVCLPLLEAFGAASSRGRRTVEPTRTIDELLAELAPAGWTRRQVRERLRRLDRRGAVECLLDGQRWRLTRHGRHLVGQLRERREVWIEAAGAALEVGGG